MSAIQFNEERHEYIVNGVVVPSVTQVLEAAGISDFSMVPAATLEHAAQRGTAVHQAAWYDDQGDLDERTVGEEIRPYLAAWRQFKADNRVQILEIEKRVYRQRRGSNGYCGTFDRLVTMAGLTGKVMLDLKTGAESPSWRVQLAAYLDAEFGLHALGVSRAAIELHRDGKYSVRWYSPTSLVRDMNVFAGALAVYEFRKEHNLI